MYKNKRIVVVIPSGRKATLEVLVGYLKRESSLVDEVRLWDNCKEQSDREYIRSLDDGYFKYVPHPLNAPTGNGYGIYPFYKDCQDPGTIYVRLDDDIVYLDPTALSKLVNFRLKNPQYWLVSANVINNAICSHIHQRQGMIPTDKIYGYYCMDPVGWKDPQAAEQVHRIFLSNRRNKDYQFPRWVFWEEEQRFSINAISWLGEDMAFFEGVVDVDEEHDMSVYKPTVIKKPNVIYGEAIVAHYAFFVQRDYMNTTDILQKYKDVLNES